jgi:hypothetical protein
MMKYFDENDYLKALMDSSNIPGKTWLLEYFEIYKSTLIWPPGLPPIKRCGIVPGSMREKFHTNYRAILEGHEYELENNKQFLTIY